MLGSPPKYLILSCSVLFCWIYKLQASVKDKTENLSHIFNIRSFPLIKWENIKLLSFFFKWDLCIYVFITSVQHNILLNLTGVAPKMAPPYVKKVRKSLIIKKKKRTTVEFIHSALLTLTCLQGCSLKHLVSCPDIKCHKKKLHIRITVKICKHIWYFNMLLCYGFKDKKRWQQ